MLRTDLLVWGCQAGKRSATPELGLTANCTFEM